MDNGNRGHDGRAGGGIGIQGGFPPLQFPYGDMTWGQLFTFDTLGIILPYALIFAGVGLIESLMTLNLIDEITETRGSSNRECIGQGLANFFSGIFSGMGGCAMIGQSLINVNSGGRRRLSGITAAVLAAGLHYVCRAADRTNPHGRPGWGDVYGGHRHL